MSLIINHSKDSRSIQRVLRRSGRELSSAIERLSSGLRINSAADDPGGLSVVTRLGSRLRSVNQAIRNVNSGISVVQTAESALGESSTMLARIREIAVQAANSTATATDRAGLQAEVDGLVDELNRIGNGTEFNTRKLLDGSYREQEVSVGIDASQSVSITITDSRATSLGARAEVVGDAVGDLDLEADSVFINGRDIGPSVGDDDTLSTTLVSASALAKAAAINRVGAVTGVQAKV